ncbi:hypothetical protein SADUNF_Sadunf02G0017000 [Salix dunnii]|uniref:Transmembrane protein n=1 Tax=Salix dunnii TaxID=1413687 RepID=A0A835N5L5_9ROSI|nr:hypothetical protein SADUNF_Sadunf02G0017000 [Salix dunnii]
MALSDAVIGNLTTIYVAVIAGIKAYGLVFGRSFSGVFVLIVSTAVVGLILIGTLAWDISRKATYAISRDRVNVHEMCKGGICWHGVAVRSPASQLGVVELREPQASNFSPKLDFGLKFEMEVATRQQKNHGNCPAVKQWSGLEWVSKNGVLLDFLCISILVRFCSLFSHGLVQ